MITRRKFGISVISAGFFISLPAGFFVSCKRKNPTDKQLWEALAEVLFPPGEGPSVRQINFYHHLQFSLRDPNYDPDIQRLVLAGFEDFKKRIGPEKINEFVYMDLSKRQKQLAKLLEKNPHMENWLSRVQNFIIEACFLDPYYKVNLHETGWKWTHHHPGVPRPDKTADYKTLLEKRKKEEVFDREKFLENLTKPFSPG